MSIPCNNCGIKSSEFESLKKENKVIKDLLLKGVQSVESIDKFAQWIESTSQWLEEVEKKNNI